MPGHAPRNYFDQCKDCTNRYIGCHAKCEKYKEARAAWEKEVETLSKYKESRLIIPEKRIKKIPRAVDRRR